MERILEVIDPDGSIKIFFSTLQEYLHWCFVQNFAVTFILCLIPVVLVGSAAYAATIAESRRHKPFFFFLKGFFIPVVYPLTIKGTLEEIVIEKNVTEKKTLAMQKQDELDLDLSQPDNRDAEGNILFDQLFFAKRQLDDDGDFRGPFLMVVNDNDVRVDHIVEAKETAVAVDAETNEGEHRTLRLPYDQIDSFEEL